MLEGVSRRKESKYLPMYGSVGGILEAMPFLRWETSTRDESGEFLRGKAPAFLVGFKS